MQNKFLTVSLIILSFACVWNIPVSAIEYKECNAYCKAACPQDSLECGQKEYMNIEDGRWAVVALSSIYMRALPDYESALETQELMGRVVKIVDENSYWRKIESDQPYTAWCTEKGLVEMSASQVEEYLDSPKIIVTADYSHIYTCPSESSRPVTDLVCGDLLRYADYNNVAHAHRVKKHSYPSERSRKWVNVMMPSGETGWVKRTDVADLDKWAAAVDDCADNIISTANRFVGVPYLWGGMSSKGFDCSGLVRTVYMMNGVLLPRNASQQIYCGEKVDICEEHSDFGENIAETVGNLLPGDLLFFGYHSDGNKGDRVTHVGIYIGGGKMIHSSHLVRINSLFPDAPDYYENSWKLIGASRIIGHEDEGRNGFRPRKI